MTTRWSAFSPLIIKEYNSSFKVLLKCEQLEYFPSIVPEVYNIIDSPSLENIEEKLDKLSEKTDDILEAVVDRCDNLEVQEEKGEKFDVVGEK